MSVFSIFQSICLLPESDQDEVIDDSILPESDTYSFSLKQIKTSGSSSKLNQELKAATLESLDEKHVHVTPSIYLEGPSFYRRWSFFPTITADKSELKAIQQAENAQEYYFVSYSETEASFSIENSARTFRSAGLMCSVVQSKQMKLPVVIKVGSYFVRIEKEGKVFLKLTAILSDKKRGETQKFPIYEPLIIGRKNACLVLPDKSVSKKHVVLESHDNDIISISNCSSKNGVWALVGSSPITLQNDDILRFGSNENKVTICLI